MAVVKLLSRVVCPMDFADMMNSELLGGSKDKKEVDINELRNSATKKNELELHDFSYGISSDPLSQFAVVFAALIHDV